MNEHRTGEGGSANTPPFPRIVPDDPEPAEPMSAGADDESMERVVGEAIARPEIQPDIRPEPAWDAAEPSGARDRPRETDPAHMLPPRAATARRPRRPNRAFEELADRLEEAAERLDGFVEAQLAPAMGDRPLGAARAATSAIEDVADYLRASDLTSIRDDLSRQVQESPLRTLLIAVGAGWMLGKVLR